MPESEEITSYIELSIDNMNGPLPPYRNWRVIYYRKYNFIGSGSNALTSTVYIDGEVPSGYAVVAVQSVEKSTTQYDAEEAEQKQNLNDLVYLTSISVTNYSAPSFIGTSDCQKNCSNESPGYIERTVTYVIMPTGCIPTT